jgi:hypothetical protein
MPDHRGIRILEEVIGQRNLGGKQPLPIKRYSCTVRGVQIRGTLAEVKRRIDKTLGAQPGP